MRESRSELNKENTDALHEKELKSSNLYKKKQTSDTSMWRAWSLLFMFEASSGKKLSHLKKDEATTWRKVERK